MPAPTKVAKKLGPPPRKIAKKAVAAPAAPVELSQARIRAAEMPPIDPNSDSDLALAMREMLKGGATRGEVMHRVKDVLAGQPTRTGREKPVSTIMNHALNRATAHGYRVEESWQLVPIEGWVEPEREVPAKPVKAVKSVPHRLPLDKPAKKAVKAVAAPVAKKAVRKPAPAAPAPAATKRVGVKKPGVRAAS